MSSEIDNLKPVKYAQADGKLASEAHDKAYMEMTLNAGRHSELAKKILRQRIEKRAQEFPRWPGSPSSGVRSLWIESRFWYDRERLLPDFDDDWRKYRAKYIHSLELDPREPVHVPEFEKYMLNPIRRLYMKPGDWVESGLKKLFKLDRFYSAVYRVVITRSFMAYVGIIGVYTYYRWHHRTWEGLQGPIFTHSAPIIYADHPRFPFKNYRTHPHDHNDQEFTKRNIYKDLRDFDDTTNPL